jgi:hypothetical protein
MHQGVVASAPRWDRRACDGAADAAALSRLGHESGFDRWALARVRSAVPSAPPPPLTSIAASVEQDERIRDLLVFIPPHIVVEHFLGPMSGPGEEHDQGIELIVMGHGRKAADLGEEVIEPRRAARKPDVVSLDEIGLPVNTLVLTHLRPDRDDRDPRATELLCQLTPAGAVLDEKCLHVVIGAETIDLTLYLTQGKSGDRARRVEHRSPCHVQPR